MNKRGNDFDVCFDKLLYTGEGLLYQKMKRKKKDVDSQESLLIDDYIVVQESDGGVRVLIEGRLEDAKTGQGIMGACLLFVDNYQTQYENLINKGYSGSDGAFGVCMERGYCSIFMRNRKDSNKTITDIYIYIYI